MAFVGQEFGEIRAIGVWRLGEQEVIHQIAGGAVVEAVASRPAKRSES